MASQATNPVRRTRENRGLTQKKLAGRAGISTSYISMIESGLVPPAHVRLAVGKALGRAQAALWPGVRA